MPSDPAAEALGRGLRGWGLLGDALGTGAEEEAVADGGGGAACGSSLQPASRAAAGKAQLSSTRVSRTRVSRGAFITSSLARCLRIGLRFGAPASLEG